jgi:hypothetical protein
MTTSDLKNDEIWYLALRKLLIANGPGVIPSSIRIYAGQRFQLDGDEPIDVESLIRTRAIKIYEYSDEKWAQASMAEERAKPVRRRRNRG